MSVDTASEDVQPSNPLRVLPVTTKNFEANGRKYYVEDSLSIERYKAFQRMEIELGYGLSFSALHEKVSMAYGLLNERKDADAAVILYHIMEGSTAIAEKKPIALWVATLFVNRSDEDRTVWSKTLAEEKIADWNSIEANFFLIVALSRVANFSKSLKEISRLLETVGDIKQQMSEDLFPSETD